MPIIRLCSYKSHNRDHLFANKDVLYVFWLTVVKKSRLWGHPMEAQYVGILYTNLWWHKNGRRFADHLFKFMPLYEFRCIFIQILLKYVPKSPIDNTLELARLMVWYRTGAKPLSESLTAKFTDLYTARPPWVKSTPIYDTKRTIGYCIFHIDIIDLNCQVDQVSERENYHRFSDWMHVLYVYIPDQKRPMLFRIFNKVVWFSLGDTGPVAYTILYSCAFVMATISHWTICKLAPLNFARLMITYNGYRMACHTAFRDSHRQPARWRPNGRRELKMQILLFNMIYFPQNLFQNLFIVLWYIVVWWS